MTDGAALARAYSDALVVPLLVEALPGLRFSVGRLGSGSDVLGLDDATSRDHDWGLRLSVVVPQDAVPTVAALLEARLPERFGGHPVRFATTSDPAVRARVDVTSLVDLARSAAGIDALRPPTLLDHLALTGQAALELTAGPVFRDDGRALAALRSRLAVPEDVRRWAVASAWERLTQELPFLGRTAQRCDDAGSRLLAARLVATAMRLGFLLERRWAPYSKWLGTAFAALPEAGAIAPLLGSAAGGGTEQEREAALAAALERLAVQQGRAGPPTLRSATGPFWNRPYRSVHGLAEAVRSAVEDPRLRRVPLVGPPDVWTDDVRILTDHRLRRRMVAALLADADPGVGGDS